MPHGMTRRDFLRYSAATLSSLWLASHLPGEPGRSRAVSRAQAKAPTTGTNVLSQSGILGTPVDVSIGTDGVHWALADSGAPSAYDPVDAVWQPFGGGIDAVAYIPYQTDQNGWLTALYFFRGGEAFEAGSDTPVAIAERFPYLPPSFQSGIEGAAFGGGVGGNIFYLFAKGQFAQMELYSGGTRYLGGAIPDLFAPGSGNGGVGWPGGAWAGGKFDYVISGNDSVEGLAYFVLGDEYITADLFLTSVTTAPQPLSDLYQNAALDLLSQGGFQAVLYDGPVKATDAPLQVFGGPVAYALENAHTASAAQETYIAQQDANWPAAWHSKLSQAPAGAIGNLWSLNSAGVPLFNDGTGWTQRSAVDDGTTLAASAIDVGSDGAVFAASDDAIFRLDTSGTWSVLSLFPFRLAGLSVGHDDSLWFMDGSSGKIYTTDSMGNNLVPANTAISATDLGANRDGTIWHCDGSTQVYRYLAEGAQPSQSVNLGEVTVDEIVKVASTGFGTGLFLAEKSDQVELLHYRSEYLAKSGWTYWNGDSPHIAVGASSLFMFTEELVVDNISYVVALDTQTGVERWRHPYAGDNEFTYSPLYDPAHQLVYVVYNNDVRALNAQTGDQVWSLTLDHPVAAQPVLAEGVLLLTGVQYQGTASADALLSAVDTLDAVQRAAQGQAVEARWQIRQFADPGVSGSLTVDPLPPVYVHGTVFYPVWATLPSRSLRLLNIYRVNAATGAVANLNKPPASTNITSAVPTVAPIVAQLTTSLGRTGPSLVVSGPDALYGTTLDFDGEWLKYSPQGTSLITSNLSYFEGNIYFGDSSGNVYGLDASFKPVPNLPHDAGAGKSIAALTVRPSDGMIIFVDDSDQLSYFSPGSSSQPASVTGTTSTWQTKSRALSDVTGDGVIYAGGRWVGDVDNVGQVFGIRTNDFSAVRDFVIESQLMQDYDPGAKAVARYQTHLTVVDDRKTPQPNVGLKLWADEALSVIVAGQPYTLGPNTPLSTQTDASGTLTILSDASDLFATPLRLWAAFMDPAERIVIYPDEAFHGRLPGMTADAANDDPTTINLATGTAYGSSTPLLTQVQATSAAQQLGAVTKAMGLDGGSSKHGAAVVGVSRRYKAYADLEGYRHFSANTPATRTVVPRAPYGLSLDESNTFTAMTPAEAAAQIDALKGDGEAPPGPVGGFFSDLKHAWDDVKKGVASVEQVVVSVGDSVYAGLTVIVDGIKHVVRQVVHDIEDVARLIGAFFSKLIADIKEIIELLSLLLHFEEIVKTYHILRSALLTNICALPNVVKNKAIPTLNNFLQQGKAEVEKVFCAVKKQVDPNVSCESTAGTPAGSPAVSTFSGVGATTHSIFTVAPKGGTPTSHAVYATWGIHKVKDHYKQASTPAAAASSSDALTQFVTTFINSLTNNPALKQAFDATSSDFSATFKVRSSTQFLQMAIVDLLDIMQDLLVSGLAVVEAFLDGLLVLADDMIEHLFGVEQNSSCSDRNGGILLKSLNIPIISDLFKLLTGSDLSFFDLIVFIASIPVTLLYRIVDGSWLSSQASQNEAVDLPNLLNSTPLAKAFGLLEGVAYVGNMLLAPVAETIDETDPTANVVLLTIGTTINTVSLATSFGWADEYEWTSDALQLGMIFASVLPLEDFSPILIMTIGLAEAMFYGIEKASNDMDWGSFSADILSDMPSILRPIKLLERELPVTALALIITIDMISYAATAAVEIGDVIANWDSLTLPEPTAIDDAPPDYIPPELTPRVYLPAVAN